MPEGLRVVQYALAGQSRSQIDSSPVYRFAESSRIKWKANKCDAKPNGAG
jgi:hypothetical protein